MCWVRVHMGSRCENHGDSPHLNEPGTALGQHLDEPGTALGPHLDEPLCAERLRSNEPQRSMRS